MKIVSFFTVETGNDHKHVESGETGNTCKQSETFLKALTADHEGRLTEILNL